MSIELNNLKDIKVTFQKLSALYMFYFLYNNGLIKSSSIDFDNIINDPYTKMRRKISFYLKSVCEKKIKEEELDTFIKSISINYDRVSFSSFDYGDVPRYQRSPHTAVREESFIKQHLKYHFVSLINRYFANFNYLNGCYITETGNTAFKFFEDMSGRSRAWSPRTWNGHYGFSLYFDLKEIGSFDEKAVIKKINYDFENNNPENKDISYFVDRYFYEKVSVFLESIFNLPDTLIKIIKMSNDLRCIFLNDDSTLKQNPKITPYTLALISDSLLSHETLRRFQNQNNMDQFRGLERLKTICDSFADMEFRGGGISEEIRNTEYNGREYLLHDIIAYSSLILTWYRNGQYGIYEDIPTQLTEMNDFFINLLE